MKLLITVFFLVVFSFGYGQKYSSIDFSVGAGATAQHKIQANSIIQDNVLDSVIGPRILNWQMGLMYRKIISGKYHVKVGMNLSKIGYKYLIVYHSFDGGGFQQGDIFMGGQAFKVESEYYLLDIPFVLGYNLKSSAKLSIYGEVGVVYSLIVGRDGSTTDLITGEEVFSATETIPRFQGAYTVSLGANYKLSDSMEIYAQPQYRQQITSIGGRGRIRNGFGAGIYLSSFYLEVGFRRTL